MQFMTNIPELRDTKHKSEPTKLDVSWVKRAGSAAFGQHSGLRGNASVWNGVDSTPLRTTVSSPST